MRKSVTQRSGGRVAQPVVAAIIWEWSEWSVLNSVHLGQQSPNPTVGHCGGQAGGKALCSEKNCRKLRAVLVGSLGTVLTGTWQRRDLEFSTLGVAHFSARARLCLACGCSSLIGSFLHFSVFLIGSTALASEHAHCFWLSWVFHQN